MHTMVLTSVSCIEVSVFAHMSDVTYLHTPTQIESVAHDSKCRQQPKAEGARDLSAMCKSASGKYASANANVQCMFISNKYRFQWLPSVCA